jgi:ADP-ribose pyrophosphatase YjhB (NUDIX family)
MYNLWQVAGGKVEQGESSKQAAIRETKEETGLTISSKQCKFLINDSKFNCDIYVTRVDDQQDLQRTEPNKQGPWILIALNQFEFMAKQKELTPSLITYYSLILENVQPEEEIIVINQAKRVEEALYGEAIVLGKHVNVLIDSGAVGCIVSKNFLDQVGRDIDASTNVRIIDVTGKKTSPLGIVKQIPVQMRDIEVNMDMIVTTSSEYNVLLGNEWLQKVNATISYGRNIITIQYNGQQQEIPVTCTQKLDPTKYTMIDPTEELELEDDEDEKEITFYKAEIVDNNLYVKDRKYSDNFIKIMGIQPKHLLQNKGPGNCLC